jgi:ABC-2 type transport system ATP-binding protein
VLIIHHGKLIATGTPEELEKQLKGTTIDLLVKSDDPGKVRDLFAAVDGVDAVDAASSGTAGEIAVSIEPKENRDLREALFYACAKANVPLLMMRPSGVSLESIFLELTADVREDNNSRSGRPAREKAPQDTAKDGDGE